MQASQVNATTEFVPNDNRTELGSGLMQVNLSWDCQPGSCDDVLIALVNVHSRNDMSCSAPGRNPPCFVVRNAVSEFTEYTSSNEIRLSLSLSLSLMCTHSPV